MKLCKRGHDMAICGQDANLQCSVCSRDKKRRWYIDNKEHVLDAVKAFRVRNPEYGRFYEMKRRCESPKHIYFRHYGGRGIKVKYESYKAFVDDVGYCPGEGYSIDRINNDGHYEPGNCRWATAEQQASNRRKP